jgi:hypothetical protein
MLLISATTGFAILQLVDAVGDGQMVPRSPTAHFSFWDRPSATPTPLLLADAMIR